MSASAATTAVLAPTSVQRDLWRRLDAGHQPLPGGHARALLLTGVDADRLAAAADEVFTGVPGLATVLVERDGRLAVEPGEPVRTRAVDLRGAADPAAEALALLRAERDRRLSAPGRQVLRCLALRVGADEVVLGLAGHPLVLDLRSVYLVLGAVVQALLGRFRPSSVASALALPAAHGRVGAPGPAASWWRDRLRRWPAAPGSGAAVAAHPAATGRCRHRLDLGADRWAGLAAVAGPVAGNPSLVVVTLLARVLHQLDGRSPSFATELDLRDLLGTGPVVGALSDRIVFAVDLTRPPVPTSSREMLLRVHAALLDSVVHYLPYGELAGLGAAAPHVDVLLHYCRSPVLSSKTNDEATRSLLGLSVSLFGEPELAAGAAVDVLDAVPPCEVHLVELDGRMWLVVDHDPRALPEPDAAAVLAAVDRDLTELTAPP